MNSRQMRTVRLSFTLQLHCPCSPAHAAPRSCCSPPKQGSQDYVKQSAFVEKSDFSLLSTLPFSFGSAAKKQHSDHSLVLVQLCGTQERTPLWQESGGTREQLDLPHWGVNGMAVFFHPSLKRHQVLRTWSLKPKYAQFLTIFEMCFNNLSSLISLFLHSVTFNRLTEKKKRRLKPLQI